MKETVFIQKNKEKWSRFEELYSSTKNNPEELSKLYMDMTEDLSYAETFYKRRTVRVYLNQLAQKVFSGVHKQKGDSWKKLFTVWKKSIPLEIYRARKNLLFALVAFLIYALVGVITTYVNPDFPRVVMGDGYVNQTIANIENGNPLAIYDSQSQLSMFIHITTNNLKVAFITFFVGFFFTVGTHILLFYNGVMLGAFQYFFQTKGLLITSFLGIWIHGAFEISAIVLAGGAGITAGNGWLFPGSYTRVQSMRLAARRGFMIMLSLVPFIIIAGFLESYVTRNYQALPEWAKWAIICFSFGLILFYYVFYPIYVARKHPEEVHKIKTEIIEGKTNFVKHKIRDIGEVIADTFQFFRSYLSKFGRIVWTFCVPLIVLVVWMQDTNHYNSMLAEHWYDWQAQLQIMFGYGFKNETDWIAVGIWSVIFALLFTSIFWTFQTMHEKFNYNSFFRYCKKKLFGIWLGNLLLFASVFFLPYYFLWFAIFLLPLYVLVAHAVGLSKGGFGERLKKGFSFSAKSYGNSLFVLLILGILTVIIGQTIALVFSIHQTWTNEPMVPDLLDMLTEFVQRIAMVFTDDYMFYSNLVRQLVYLLFAFVVVSMFVIATSFVFYSTLEKQEAIGLRKEFKKFGKRKRNQETEVDFD